MSRYAPSPKAALVQLCINGENWGVYALAQNGDSDLMKDWFPNADSVLDTDANLNLLLDSTTFGPLGADAAWARPAASPTLFQIQVPSPGAANP